MLLDTSGTYTQELDKARQIIAYLLTQLDSGDAFAIARIDTGSFSEKDIVAKVVFDDRPSAANQQKRAFLEQVGAFLKTVKSSPYTDITGGLLQAQEFLHEHQLAEMTILVFSDMKEDLPEGYNRDLALTFDNAKVLAVNVTKLRTDNVDPQEYLDRLAQWQQRVETGGGEWEVINDLDRMSQLLK
ncbi:MAG: VWA domain-containing protein [Alcanivoracaceae bacterium]|nr:VWA domain-containing protein [Alcanivoracaceae bacterium]